MTIALAILLCAVGFIVGLALGLATADRISVEPLRHASNESLGHYRKGAKNG